MSDRIEDGGAAFPLAWTETNEHGVQFTYRQPGMSLRDQIAVQVIGAVIASFDKHLPSAASVENIAAHSYRIADAMIRARQMGAQTGGGRT